MNEKMVELIDDIGSLTIDELSQFIDALKKRFNVQDIVPTQVVTTFEEVKEEEEQTEFDVILVSSGEKRISVLKLLRELTGAGLKEAKDMIDNLPYTVKEGITKEESENMKNRLIEVGAIIEIK